MLCVITYVYGAVQSVKKGEGHVERNGGRRTVIIGAQREVPSCRSKCVEARQGDTADAGEPMYNEYKGYKIVASHIPCTLASMGAGLSWETS